MRRREFLAGAASLITFPALAGTAHPGRLLIPAGSMGTFANLLTNSAWANNSSGIPVPGWTEVNSGGKSYVDMNGYYEFTAVAAADRQHLYWDGGALGSLQAGRSYTIGAYITDANITGGANQIMRVSATGGTDLNIRQSFYTTPGWYAGGFTMGAADSAADVSFGLGGGGTATGTTVLRMPFVYYGFQFGVEAGVPLKLTNPIRWSGSGS